MVKGPESLITAKIMTWLKKQPRCWCFKVHGNRFQISGLPDIIGLCDGHFFAIEVKQPDEVPTKLQQHFIDLIVSCGGTAFAAHSLDEVKDVWFQRDRRL